MKTVLFILLLASVAVNAVLLSGCRSVSGTRVFAPPAFRGETLEVIHRALPDNLIDQFNKLNSYAESQHGKGRKVIVIDTEGELDGGDMVILRLKK